jgi:hypothetical protein
VRGLLGRLAPLAMKVSRPACSVRQRTMRLVLPNGSRAMTKPRALRGSLMKRAYGKMIAGEKGRYRKSSGFGESEISPSFFPKES